MFATSNDRDNETWHTGAISTSVCVCPDVCGCCPGFQSKFYAWPVCLCLSRFGVQRWGINRRVILTVIGGFITFVGIVLNLIGCLGLSTDLDFIRDVYWAKYTYLQMDVYMNLSTLRLGTVTKTWTEMGLQSCGDASDGLQVMMITSTVLLLVVLFFCVKRGRAERDLIVSRLERSSKIGGGDGTGMKLGSLFSSFAQVLSPLHICLFILLCRLPLSVPCTLAATAAADLPRHCWQALITYIMLGDFGERCIQPINDEYDPSYGSGFICPLLASCLMGVVFILHLFVPCPDQAITSSEETGLIKSASKLNASEENVANYLHEQETSGGDISSGATLPKDDDGALGEGVGITMRQFSASANDDQEPVSVQRQRPSHQLTANDDQAKSSDEQL